jgi:hypothetical protein
MPIRAVVERLVFMDVSESVMGSVMGCVMGTAVVHS